MIELLAQAAPRTFLVFAALFGAIVGSFLNVVIARVPAGESIVSPPSRCPRCQAPIAWTDNLPVLSFLLLRGRCRSCAAPIPLRYPVVETLGAVLAVAMVARFGWTAQALASFALAAALVALSYIDLDTWTLPLPICLPLLGLGLLSPLWNPGLGRWLAEWGLLAGQRPLLQAFAASIAGAALGAGFLALVAVVSSRLLGREAMGWGDVWLLGAIGAWLGVQSLFAVVMFSAAQGAVVGGLLLAFGRAPGRRDLPPDEEDGWTPDPHAVPYGPFLALAALEQLLLGERIWGAWQALLARLWS